MAFGGGCRHDAAAYERIIRPASAGVRRHRSRPDTLCARKQRSLSFSHSATHACIVSVAVGLLLPLAEFAHWHRYRDMIRLLPIAVVDRPSYSFKAIATGRRLLGRQTKVTKMRYAIMTKSVNLPGWCFITGQLNAASATEIRQQTQGRTCK